VLELTINTNYWYSVTKKKIEEIHNWKRAGR